jgi:hypothetical protein
MEFYLTIKKNEILSFAGKWMEVEDIIFNEANHLKCSYPHSGSQKPHIFSHNWNTDLIQIYQYKEKEVTLRGGHT